MVPARRFETVQRPRQIGLENIGRTAVKARVHRRLRRALDQEVEAAGLGEVVGCSHVAMDELDAVIAKPGEPEFTAAPPQIVEGADFDIGLIASQHQRQAGTHETGAAGDENAHVGLSTGRNVRTRYDIRRMPQPRVNR